jgi:hypothetical protein
VAAPVTLTLLVRAYCHLCDEMREAVAPIAAAADALVVEVDIDADPVLEARFGERVPVLLEGGVDGREICHFMLDAARLRQVLAGRAR